jgi:hypothetical protein
MFLWLLVGPWQAVASRHLPVVLVVVAGHKALLRLQRRCAVGSVLEDDGAVDAEQRLVVLIEGQLKGSGAED